LKANKKNCTNISEGFNSNFLNGRFFTDGRQLEAQAFVTPKVAVNCHTIQRPSLRKKRRTTKIADILAKST